MERMKSAVKSKSEAVKMKVQELVESPTREGNAWSNQQHTTVRVVLEPIKHVKSTDRTGKRYRNVQSVFSIHDDDETPESEDDLTVRDADELLASEKVSRHDFNLAPAPYFSSSGARSSRSRR